MISLARCPMQVYRTFGHGPTKTMLSGIGHNTMAYGSRAKIRLTLLPAVFRVDDTNM
jgi:hypothetical protein